VFGVSVGGKDFLEVYRGFLACIGPACSVAL
jgi:hypothetical protein